MKVNTSELIEKVGEVDAKTHLETLSAVKTASRVYDIPEGVKDCVKLMLQAGCEYPGREGKKQAVFIISELKNNGVKESKAEIVLEAWNGRGQARIKDKDLKDALKTYRKNKSYNYICGTAENKPWRYHYCEAIGRETCNYYRVNTLHKKPKVKHYEAEYYKAGWHLKTTAGELALYFGLINLERKRRKPAGYKFYIGYRELAQETGLRADTLKKKAVGLAEKGLINFKPGKPGSRYKRASEFERIIPIPGLTS